MFLVGLLSILILRLSEEAWLNGEAVDELDELSITGVDGVLVLDDHGLDSGVNLESE